MFIFTDAVKTDDVEQAVGVAREEIEKLGGSVDSTTRLGKRSFARVLKKQDAGQYAVVTFRLESGQLDALRARYRLNEQILRVQFIRLKPGAAEAVATGTTKEKSDG
jgi:ribosomal protein S6